MDASKYQDNLKANGIQQKNEWSAHPLSPFKIGNYSHAQQAKHTLANCEGCYHAYKEFQATFPGKPMFIAEPQIVQLLETPSTSRKVLARRVLNSSWKGKFNHTFSTALPQNVPEAKKSKIELKRNEKVVFRNDSSHSM